MTLAALIRKRGAGKVANDNPAKAANDGLARERPLAGLATLALANSTSLEVAPLLDPAAEARRKRVIELLAANPSVRYVLVTDSEGDPEGILLTLAIRGRATCELCIPRDKYDPFLLLTLIERHGGTVH